MFDKYGHAVHVWDLHKRRHRQVLELGPEYQMVLELRPAHDPAKAYEFVGVVTSLKDLSASVWLWHREDSNGNGTWKIRKVGINPGMGWLFAVAFGMQERRRGAASSWWLRAIPSTSGRPLAP